MRQSQDSSLLSYGQQALWYLNQLEPDSTAYHLGVCLKLTGRLDENALAAAWRDVLSIHPQLRSRFVMRDGRPGASAAPDPEPLVFSDGGPEAVRRAWKEVAARPFSLDREAPVRAALVRGAAGEYRLLLCLHHIAGDLWSSATVLRELSECYAARAAGGAPVLPREREDYAAFAAEERLWLEGPRGRAAWDYWRARLDGRHAEPIYSRATANEHGGELTVSIGADNSAAILAAAHERGTTPYPLLLAGYARLLGDETGREELIIGTPAAIRDRAALRGTVGYLVNAVPVPCPLDGRDPAGDVAESARRALEHRRFPFPVLVERLRIPRVPDTTPLFQTMFAYQALPRADRALLPLALNTGGARWDFGGGLCAETEDMPPFDAQFPVALTLGRAGDGFSGKLQYDGRRVSRAQAQVLAQKLPSAILGLLAPSGVRPRAPERIENLFDAAAERSPDAIAASENGTDLSYADMQQRAEALAAGLDAALAGREGPVAMQLPSNAEASTVLLAILKSGRTFLPLDLDEPIARRNAALKRARAVAIVLRDKNAAGRLPRGVAALSVDSLKPGAPGAARPVPARAAYIVFTSGSTGEPKAVEVGHGSVINHARASVRLFGLTPDDRVLQFHTLAFDASFEEIFPTWAAGARVVYEPTARRMSVPAVLETVERAGVSVLNLPTSYWHTLTEEASRAGLRPGPKLRLVVVGGERASEKAYASWRKVAPGCRWINTYGPTETTITALAYALEPGAPAPKTLPIGRPIDGATALVEDGELLIGGEGLAFGYLGDPTTTAAKFVERIVGGKTRRFYRSGDRVGLNPDGEFEFLGRIDRQLKIRGYRVDPEEIERALRSHRSVSDATVRPAETNGEPRLAAWIVRAKPAAGERQLRAYLAGLLPAHMIPEKLIFVTKLPRKASGKLDSAALGAPARPKGKARSPRGAVEVAELFSELLGHKVGVDDDFFLSGGHSLLAIRLLGRVESRFGARISPADFAASPTPAGISKRLARATGARSAYLAEPLPAEIPATMQQRRALLAHDIDRPALANIALLFRVRGRMDEKLAERSLDAAVRRHPLLRCAFVRGRDGVVMREAQEPPRLERRALRVSAEEFVRAEARKPFSLDGRRPWFRWILATGPKKGERYLLVITHHAVADGWALELFLGDLLADPGGSADDYRSYALRQARRAGGDEARAEAAWWKAKLAGAEEPRLPFRRPAPAGPSWACETFELELPRPLSDRFRRTAAAFGTTPFALAMACFKALVHRYGGQTDVVLGTMVSNRSGETRGIFGPMQNPVLIRDVVRAESTMRDVARAVSRSLTEAQKYGESPLERSFEGGVQFISHDRTLERVRLGGAELIPVEHAPSESPFELCIAASTAGPRLCFEFEHRPSAYSAAAVRRLAAQYAVLIESVVREPKTAISELPMLPVDEARSLRRRSRSPLRAREELLHAGFEASVRRTPGALALAWKGGRMTYGQLDDAVGVLAGDLAARGLGTGELVAVSLPKGPRQVVACLAVLRAGGAYVPVDPAQPAARRDAVLGRGGFRAIITATGVETLSGRRATPRRRAKPSPGTLAYVIFTSGSTGTPKGVMITHRQAMTTVAEINRRFAVGPRDRVLAVSSLGFDLSVFDMFGLLRAGGAVVMPSGSDPKEWLELCAREKVTIWNSAPCLLELLLDEAASRPKALEKLRLIMLSGDFISLPLARRARAELPKARFVSLGGATEGAIWSIAREVDAVEAHWRSVPYGRALRDQELFVLDRKLRHCPIGVSGELFIAGAGVAAGYWRDRKETARRFLREPRLGGPLYRTGDQGRYIEDGEIEILGRLDEQVKINGVRVELGEIEAALCSSPLVRHALADVVAGAAGKRLVAFVAASPGTTAADIASHARKRLPVALLPTSYTILERLPLTANGKVDRTALRALSPAAPATAVALLNDDERWIASLWSELLGGAAVGPEDDFFALGGHSLLAIKMLQRVRLHFRAELPLSLVVERPTVRGLAAAVRSAASGAPAPTLPRRPTAELEVDSEPAMPEPVRRAGPEPEAVFLTGATGHLGAAVLSELLKRPGLRVLCLVRGDSHPEAARRLELSLAARQIDATGRIEAVTGDLSRENLGLPRAEFLKLAASVKAVYHCAAEVNFIARYEKLAPGNVGGTREMIRLAAAGGSVLHHVSSVAVFPYGGDRVIREDEDISRVTALRGGYAQSKWASERMVWKAAALGLRMAIYRPAQIVGRDPDAPAHDLYDHAVRACRAVRAVPDIDAHMDMVTSDFAAAALVALSENPAALGKAFHLVHPRPIALREFAARLPSPLPLLPLRDWLERVEREAGRTEDPSLQLVSMLAHGLDRSELTPPSFDCSSATENLRLSGIVCPPIGAP